jgi:hypothetical protein
MNLSSNYNYDLVRNVKIKEHGELESRNGYSPTLMRYRKYLMKNSTTSFAMKAPRNKKIVCLQHISRVCFEST